MKKRPETRNYRRVRDKSGAIIANIITIDGVDVEVTEEVFLAYSQADRRERYISEEVEPRKVLSLEKLEEDGVPLASLGVEAGEDPESMMLAQERKHQVARLVSALAELDKSEQQLIQVLFFNGISARTYAKQLGVRLNTVQYRRDKLLKRLRQKIFS